MAIMAEFRTSLKSDWLHVDRLLWLTTLLKVTNLIALIFRGKLSAKFNLKYYSILSEVMHCMLKITWNCEQFDMLIHIEQKRQSFLSFMKIMSCSIFVPQNCWWNYNSVNTDYQCTSLKERIILWISWTVLVSLVRPLFVV